VELKTPRVPASAANAATNLHKQTSSRSQTLDFFFTQEKGNCIFGVDTRLAALISQSFIMQKWLRIELLVLLGFIAIKK
jgi:hypothetical protein